MLGKLSPEMLRMRHSAKVATAAKTAIIERAPYQPTFAAASDSPANASTNGRT